ncbi:MAG: tRNA (adenosine(37)-N6)-threonylcarbamoyltransferase complex dimerization subunit type 1 TsaB [Candidatus Aminicenantes bacterium]|nr:tRNA (adenosine(37)-N6)-threonylcarbamoyltransferase complex dimerization subunit type 1 TsaB [Candidatus Aminicenantes bacterium]
MSLVVGLDTTSRHASIALVRDDQLVIEYNFITRDELSATLVPAISFMLKSVGVAVPDIDLFGVGIGPGLFTGLRIGLTTLKGLLFSDPRPVVPVVTLEALAWKLRQSRRLIVPLIDARRREVYMAAYRFSGEDLAEEVLSPRLVGIEDLTDILAGWQDLRFTGSGVSAYRRELNAMFPGFRSRGRSSFLASEICRISVIRHARNESLTRLEDLQPLYLRPPDAEAATRE